jgi:hypothetical protein
LPRPVARAGFAGASGAFSALSKETGVYGEAEV